MAQKVDRLTRVNELIKREIANLMEKYALTPSNMLLSVTEVTASVDLRNATVKISIFGGDAKQRHAAWKELEAKRCEFQRHLARTLGFKHTPVIAFKEDTTLAKGDRVFQLLNAEEPPRDEK